ncbi:hypothetical protein [Methylobacterium nodulans]|uniref:hypothetical protein n=1 Tax=Methylobacterium nodulans TaxID=114616 RepID=UPI0012EDCAE2|nr:hypothetical protein [Methylobacterium nodulans]
MRALADHDEAPVGRVSELGEVAMELLSRREYSVDEAAAATGLSQDAPKVNLHRARRDQRIALTGERGGSVTRLRMAR